MLGAALTSAAAMGLLGGLHCAGMCGPIAIAACGDRASLGARAVLDYLGGRFFAYTLIGAVCGAFGAFFERDVFSPARVALILAVALWFVVRGVRAFRERETVRAAEEVEQLVQLPRRSTSARKTSAQKPQIARPSLVPSAKRRVGLGLLTGIMPCGLLFGAVSLAAATASPVDGALVMFVLAATTLPGLFLPVVMRRAIHRLPWLKSPKVQGAMWCVLGVWLSVRPVLELFEGARPACHG